MHPRSIAELDIAYRRNIRMLRDRRERPAGERLDPRGPAHRNGGIRKRAGPQ